VSTKAALDVDDQQGGPGRVQVRRGAVVIAVARGVARDGASEALAGRVGLDAPGHDALGAQADRGARLRDGLGGAADLDAARSPRVRALEVVDHDRGAA
jgi:hypothetical protein